MKNKGLIEIIGSIIVVVALLTIGFYSAYMAGWNKGQEIPKVVQTKAERMEMGNPEWIKIDWDGMYSLNDDTKLSGGYAIKAYSWQDNTSYIITLGSDGYHSLYKAMAEELKEEKK